MPIQQNQKMFYKAVDSQPSGKCMQGCVVMTLD